MSGGVFSMFTCVSLNNTLHDQLISINSIQRQHQLATTQITLKLTTMSNAPTTNQVTFAVHSPPSLSRITTDTLSTKAVQDTGKPHGKNITEVSSFDDNAPNASNNEVGSKDDPSRVAINHMQETDVPSSGVPGDRANKIDNENKFNAMGGDASA
jgi:hypothetical protein